MRKLLLLRPEPGLSLSVGRARSLGLETIACPLFEVEAVGWDVPDADAFDAILLTSANAVRHAGPGLQALRKLPVHAVGKETAAAARAAGLDVGTTGSGSVATLLASLPAGQRLLHLAGEDRVEAEDSGMIVDRITIYRSAAITDPALPPIEGLVVAVHSPRAGRRLAEIAPLRDRTRIAAISASAARSCGTGWESVDAASSPDDASLLALAASLCQTTPQ